MYEKRREEIKIYLELVKEKWRVSQCEKIAFASSDKEKWKIINIMTNSTAKMEVQPIRHINEVSKEVEYLFDDVDILNKMEKYHIMKEPVLENSVLCEQISRLKQDLTVSDENDIMK